MRSVPVLKNDKFVNSKWVATYVKLAPDLIVFDAVENAYIGFLQVYNVFMMLFVLNKHWFSTSSFYPQGALMLFYVARIALLKGNITFVRDSRQRLASSRRRLFCWPVAFCLPEAQEKYQACIAAQQEWRQIHHLCYWELMWAHSFEQNWREAYHYADLLCKESKWSQVTTET